MNKFIKKIKNNQVLYVLSILIIGILLLLIARITYAYLAPRIQSALSNITTISDTVDDFKLELGQPLSLNATATTLPESGSNLVVTSTEIAKLKANSTKKTANYNYYLYLQITNNTFKYSDGTTPEIILTITDPNGNEITSLDNLTYGTYNGVSGFDVTTKTGLFAIANNYEITSNSSTTYTEHDWNITLTYLNLNIDQSGNYGNSFETKLYLQKEEKELTATDVCPGKSLSDCVIAQYTGIKNSNIYYHDSNLTNGAGDNSYRYAGASDQVNNYVCFGSTQSPCPADNLYRIIGVFGDKVKLIKSDYATSTLLGTDGDYSKMLTVNSWDNSNYKGNNLANIVRYTWNYKNNTTINNGHGSNTWSTSLLNKTNLNKNFITNIGADWAAKIAETTWKVGGNTETNIINQPAKIAYQNEIVSPVTKNTTDNATTYSAKVGLMYASDYGFAALPSAWTANLNTYNGDDIKNVNWMYMGLYEWTLSRYADYAFYVFYVNNTGNLNSYDASSALALRPVFSLTSSVNYVSGSGTATDPIVVN